MNSVIKSIYFIYLLDNDNPRSWLNIVASKFIDKYKAGANNA